MDQKVQLWSEKTSAIFTGVLIYSISNLVYGIINLINSYVNTASIVTAAMDGNVDGMFNAGFGVLTIIGYILLIGVIVGYFLYLKGLTDFRTILNHNDSEAVNKIRIGVILNLVAAVVTFIPLLGIVAGILNLIAFIMIMIGFYALKSSMTFPELARKGASTIFIAMILSIVGGVFSIIPVIGSFVYIVLLVVSFFMILSGWSSIKNATPVEGTDPMA